MAAQDSQSTLAQAVREDNLRPSLTPDLKPKSIWPISPKLLSGMASSKTAFDKVAKQSECYLATEIKLYLKASQATQIWIQVVVDPVPGSRQSYSSDE